MLAASSHAATEPDQTIKNRHAASRGEFHAHHRYAFFVEKADRKGYDQVAELPAGKRAACRNKVEKFEKVAVTAPTGDHPCV